MLSAHLLALSKAPWWVRGELLRLLAFFTCILVLGISSARVPKRSVNGTAMEDHVLATGGQLPAPIVSRRPSQDLWLKTKDTVSFGKIFRL